MVDSSYLDIVAIQNNYYINKEELKKRIFWILIKNRLRKEDSS